MHTHKTSTEFGGCLHRADVSPKEQRLLYATPRGREGAGEQPEGGNAARGGGGPVEAGRREAGDNVRRLAGGAMEGQPGVQDAVDEGRRRANEDATRRRAAPLPPASDVPVVPVTAPIAPQPQQGWFRRAWSEHIWPTTKDVGIVGGATGATIGAATYATELAKIHPYLGAVGKFAEGIVGGLSSSLGAVPAWTIPLALGGGLWVLGKSRVAHLKTVLEHGPDNEEKARELERLNRIGFFGNMSEGVKLIGGGIQRVTRFIPVGVGKITGYAEHLTGKFFKKMGGITNAIKWPWQNKKHLAWGGVGAAGAGSLLYGVAGAGGIALGGAAIPLAALVGGIWAYRHSKYGGKGGGAEIASAES